VHLRHARYGRVAELFRQAESADSDSSSTSRRVVVTRREQQGGPFEGSGAVSRRHRRRWYIFIASIRLTNWRTNRETDSRSA
jgi:hypothetical protein